MPRGTTSKEGSGRISIATLPIFFTNYSRNSFVKGNDLLFSLIFVPYNNIVLGNRGLEVTKSST